MLNETAQQTWLLTSSTSGTKYQVIVADPTNLGGLTRVVNTWNETRIEKLIKEKTEIEKALECLRASYKQIANMPSLNDDQKQSFLDKIKNDSWDLLREKQAFVDFKTLKQRSIENHEKCCDDVTLLICWLTMQVNLSHGLQGEQIRMLSEDIVGAYSSMLYEEVALVFGNGLKGMYGQLSFRLDAQIIHGWIARYREQRKANHIEANERNHASNGGYDWTRQMPEQKAIPIASQLETIALLMSSKK